jgi:hypothetical protein
VLQVGTVLVRYVSRHVDSVSATAWHLLMGGLVLGSAAATSGVPAAEALTLSSLGASLSTQLSALTASDLAAMAFVSLGGGALAYGLYFQAAAQGNMTRLSRLVGPCSHLAQEAAWGTMTTSWH